MVNFEGLFADRNSLRIRGALVQSYLIRQMKELSLSIKVRRSVFQNG